MSKTDCTLTTDARPHGESCTLLVEARVIQDRLTGLAVCLRDYRLPLVAAESVAFFLAGAGVADHLDTLARARRAAGTAGRGA